MACLPVIDSYACRSIGFFLRVRLLLQQSCPDSLVSLMLDYSTKTESCPRMILFLKLSSTYLPSLVVLSPPMRKQVRLALKPLGAVNTVLLTEARKVLGYFSGLMQLKMASRMDIRMDLI